jgi:hypothetical protein
MSAMLQKNLNKVLDTVHFVGANTPDEIYSVEPRFQVAPAFGSYTSCLNPINLFSVLDYSLFKKLRFALIRDGVIPLTYFFTMYPTPESINTVFLIHETLSPFIPKAWWDNVVLYSHAALARDEAYCSKKSTLYVTASLDQFSFEKDYFKEKIGEIKNHCAELGLKRIKVLFNNRKNPLLHNLEDISRYFNQRNQEFLTELDGLDIGFVTKKKILNSNELGKAYCIDMDDRSLFSVDSYINQILWSNNCLPVYSPKAELKQDSERFVRTSSYHGIILKSEKPEYYQDLSVELEEMMSEFGVKSPSSKSEFPKQKKLFNKSFYSYLTDRSREFRQQSKVVTLNS